MVFYALICNNRGMNSTILTAPKQTAVQKVCRENQVSYLALFGSRARGDHTTDSDVDLLVEFSEKKSFFDLARLQHTLEQIFGHEVELVPRNSVKPALKTYIYRDLSPLYDEKG